MDFYTLTAIKFALGILTMLLQINILGKRDFSLNTPLNQVQNYVLGGIIGGVIYSSAISVIDFLLVLVAWTLLVLLLKFIKANNRRVKEIVDGTPAILIERGKILMDECMRQGLLAHDLTLKLRLAGVYYIKDVKRAVLEPNGQLTIMQYGEEYARYPLILDGQVDEDILELIEKDHVWLNAALRDAGYELKNVYVGEYKDGNLAIYPYT